MAITERKMTIETKANVLELTATGGGGVNIHVKELCTEANDYEVGNQATLFLSQFDIEELHEVLGTFRY